MSLHPTVVALEQVLHGAVLGIRHHRVCRLTGGGLVAVQEGFEYVGLVGVPRRGPGVGNDLVFPFHGPVDLVGQLGLALPGHRCVRVGRTDPLSVDLLERGTIGLFLFFQPPLELRVAFVEAMPERARIYQRLHRSVRLHDAGIHKDLTAVDQPSFHALPHDALEEATEYVHPPALACLGQDTVVRDRRVEFEP